MFPKQSKDKGWRWCSCRRPSIHMALFWPPKGLHTCAADIHIQTKMYKKTLKSSLETRKTRKDNVWGNSCATSPNPLSTYNQHVFTKNKKHGVEMLQQVKLLDYKPSVPSSIPEPNGGGKKTPLSYPLEEKGGAVERTWVLSQTYVAAQTRLQLQFQGSDTYTDIHAGKHQCT